MSIIQDLFGTLPDGRQVYRYTLCAHGLRAAILDLGGAIQQLLVPDAAGRLVDVACGFDDARSYLEGNGSHGALIGRFGNRIADGKFMLDGKTYTLYCNNGKNHLHGGKVGFHLRTWQATPEDGDEPKLHLTYVSPDGEEGYPGTLSVTVTYTLTARRGLSIRYVAETDAPTVLNLTNHTYFNLGGFASGSVLDHTLLLDADTYLPTDAGLIPTGEFRPVDGTPFDFRTAKPIGRDFYAENDDLKTAGGYDHCFNFTGGETRAPVLRGALCDPKSGRVMYLYTNQPSVQCYTANFLNVAEFPLKGGLPQKTQSAVCLETQKMPDSPNRPHFTDTVLRPGETYDYTTEYVFDTL